MLIIVYLSSCFLCFHLCVTIGTFTQFINEDLYYRKGISLAHVDVSFPNRKMHIVFVDAHALSVLSVSRAFLGRESER